MVSNIRDAVHVFGCTRKDCGKCENCKDMHKFGGSGRKNSNNVTSNGNATIDNNKVSGYKGWSKRRKDRSLI